MSKDKIEDAIYTRRYIYNFHYHLIWVTKYRNPTFTSEAIAHTGYLELFDLVVKHILPGMGLLFTLCCISIVNSPDTKKTPRRTPWN